MGTNLDRVRLSLFQDQPGPNRAGHEDAGQNQAGALEVLAPAFEEAITAFGQEATMAAAIALAVARAIDEGRCELYRRVLMANADILERRANRDAVPR